MKKLLACMLVLCLAVSLGAAAFASGEPSGSAEADYAALRLDDAVWTKDEATGAWCLTGVSYCQVVNIFVPGAYMNEDGTLTEKVVNGYNAATAPILLLNDIGGYAQAKPSSVGRCAAYLEKGYVVVCPGVRGRDTVTEDGAYVGRFAAGLADLKAAVRFLRYNDDVLAGDAECIVSMGRSAGGALSAALGVTGNNPVYDPYLAEIGAVLTERDDIYAAQCYCPITDFEHQNMAYEWFYHDNAAYTGLGSGEPSALNAAQQAMSDDLAAAFVEYVNGLGLAPEGENLTLDGLRSGSYYDYILSTLEGSLAAYLEKSFSVTVSGMSPYTYLDEDAVQAYLDELNAAEDWVSVEYTYAKASTGPSTIVTYADGCVVTMTGLDAFTEHFHSRVSAPPVFDDPDFADACNALFADETGAPRHYDVTLQHLIASGKYDALDGWDASMTAAYAGAESIAEEVSLINPLLHMDGSDVAPFFRIRTGTNDQFASIAESADLAAFIRSNSDAAVDYALAWGQPHGDAEIDGADLFTWIERVCKFERSLSDEQIASVLDLDNMEYEWTLSGEGEKAVYILSPVVDAAKPELAAYQGCSVAIPAYYVKGVNADGSLEFDYDYEFVNPNGVTYTAATAPIIVNTGAAGYSAGTTGKAGAGYVGYGYINVACGNRGKSLSAVNACGEKYYCGDAPYCLVDQKACVRWIKYNIALGNLCGDPDRMVSTGGSGGGAHSMLLAATGNNPDFFPYLEESGAVMRYSDASGKVVEISDAIWGACPYSAITNLEEANMAYEFESGLAKDDALVSRYSAFRQLLSQGEAEEYMDYINALGLTYDIDGDGVREALTIEYDAKTDTWSGSYIELMEQVAEEQLAWHLNHMPENEQDWVLAYDGESYAEAYLHGDYAGSGEMSGEPSGETEGYASENNAAADTGTGEDLTEWVTVTVDENGVYSVDFDIADFMIYRGRSKTNPSFDDLDLGQAENQVFGDFDQDFRHWDIHVLNAFDKYYDELDAAYDGTDAAAESFEELYAAYKADIEQVLAGDKFGNNIVKLYNPLNYILDPRTELPAWVHNCHGSADTDSSVLISMNDGVALDMMGVDSFFAWSWDDHHVAGEPAGLTMPGTIDAMVLAGK